MAVQAYIWCRDGSSRDTQGAKKHLIALPLAHLGEGITPLCRGRDCGGQAAAAAAVEADGMQAVKIFADGAL